MKKQVIEAYSKLHPNKQTEYAGSILSFDGSQIEEEFFKCWNRIDEYYKKNKVKELKFLEVGAWKGLWGIAFCEYCKIHNIKGIYTTITYIKHDENNNSLFDTLDYLKNCGLDISLVNCNTLDDWALPKVTENNKSYNIVLIDAGHKYEEVMNDIRKFKPLAEDILLFHDIRPKEVNDTIGVYQAINHSLIDLDEEIVTNEKLMGIGIKYIKNA